MSASSQIPPIDDNNNATYIIDTSASDSFTFDDDFLNDVHCTPLSNVERSVTTERIANHMASADVDMLHVTSTFDDDDAMHEFISGYTGEKYDPMFTQKRPYRTCTEMAFRKYINNVRVVMAATARDKIMFQTITEMRHRIQTKKDLKSLFTANDQKHMETWMETLRNRYNLVLSEFSQKTPEQQKTPELQRDMDIRMFSVAIDSDEREFLEGIINQDESDREILKNIFAHVHGENYENEVLTVEKLVRLRMETTDNGDDVYANMMGMVKAGKTPRPQEVITAYANVLLASRRRDVHQAGTAAMRKMGSVGKVALGVAIGLLLKAANFSVLHVFMLSDDWASRLIGMSMIGIPIATSIYSFGEWITTTTTTTTMTGVYAKHLLGDFVFTKVLGLSAACWYGFISYTGFNFLSWVSPSLSSWMAQTVTTALSTIVRIPFPLIGTLLNIPDTIVLYHIAMILIDISAEWWQLGRDELAVHKMSGRSVSVREILGAGARMLYSYPMGVVASLYGASKIIETQWLFHGVSDAVFARAFDDDSPYYGNIGQESLTSFYVSGALLLFTITNHNVLQPWLIKRAKSRWKDLASASITSKPAIKLIDVLTGQYTNIRNAAKLFLMDMGVNRTVASIGGEVMNLAIILFFAKYFPTVVGYAPEIKNFIGPILTGMSMMNPVHVLRPLPGFSMLHDTMAGLSTTMLAKTLSLYNVDTVMSEKFVINGTVVLLAGYAYSKMRHTFEDYISSVGKQRGPRNASVRKTEQNYKKKIAIGIAALLAGGGIASMYTGAASSAGDSSALQLYTVSGGASSSFALDLPAIYKKSSNMAYDAASSVVRWKSDMPAMYEKAYDLVTVTYDYYKEHEPSPEAFNLFLIKQFLPQSSLLPLSSVSPDDAFTSMKLVFGSDVVNSMAIVSQRIVKMTANGKPIDRLAIKDLVRNEVDNVAKTSVTYTPRQYDKTNTPNKLHPFSSAYVAHMIMTGYKVDLSAPCEQQCVTQYFVDRVFTLVDNAQNPHVGTDEFGLPIYINSPHIVTDTPLYLDDWAMLQHDTSSATNAYEFNRFLFNRGITGIADEFPSQDNTIWSVTDTNTATAHALRSNRAYYAQVALLMHDHYYPHFRAGLSLLSYAFQTHTPSDLLEAYTRNPANADIMSQQLTQYYTELAKNALGLGVDAPLYAYVRDPHSAPLETQLLMYQVLIANYKQMLNIYDTDFERMRTHIEIMSPGSRHELFKKIVMPKSKNTQDSFLSPSAYLTVKSNHHVTKILQNTADITRIDSILDAIDTPFNALPATAQSMGNYTVNIIGTGNNTYPPAQLTSVLSSTGVHTANVTSGSNVTNDDASLPLWKETLLDLRKNLTNENNNHYNELAGLGVSVNISSPANSTANGAVVTPGFFNITLTNLRLFWKSFDGHTVHQTVITAWGTTLTETWETMIKLFDDTSGAIKVLVLCGFMFLAMYKVGFGRVKGAALTTLDKLSGMVADEGGIPKSDMYNVANVDERLRAVHLVRKLTYNDPFPALSALGAAYDKYRHGVHAVTEWYTGLLREVHRAVCLDARVRKTFERAKDVLFPFGDPLALYYLYIVAGIPTNTIAPGNVITPSVARILRRIVRTVYPISVVPKITDAAMAGIVEKAHKYADDDSLHDKEDTQLSSLFLLPLISPLHVYMCERTNVLILNAPELLGGKEYVLDIPDAGVALGDGLTIHQDTLDAHLVLHHIMTEGARAVHVACMRVGNILV